MNTIDPKVFLPASISKATAEFNQGIHEIISAVPPTYTQPPQQTRDDREAGKGLWPAIKLDVVQDWSAPGPEGDVPLRVYIPETVKGVYLHIHGGGFMLGRAHQSDVGLVKLADECQLVTCSVDYRLAPEDPYPAGPDDCETAALWLIENAIKEFGTDVIIIGGESAGANLSVVTLMRMRDHHGYSGFTAANLAYGVYDLSMTPSTRRWGETPNYVLTTHLMEWFSSNYAPAGKHTDPDASPLYADLSNLPPALFTIGTQDPLLDDSLFMHARWLAAGNASEIAIYPGGIHAFNAFPIELANQANARMEAFIRQHV
jgi:acetyl esterase